MGTTKPSKEQVQAWMQSRRDERTAPPSPERIRQQLGWHLTQPYVGPSHR